MRNPLRTYLTVAFVAGLAAMLLCACGSIAPNVNYYINIPPDSIRYANEVTIEPGQGGDATDSSTLAASSQGGEGLSPGNNIVNRGICDYGIIFNIGTETPSVSTPTTSTDAQATVDGAMIP